MLPSWKTESMLNIGLDNVPDLCEHVLRGVSEMTDMSFKQIIEGGEIDIIRKHVHGFINGTMHERLRYHVFSGTVSQDWILLVLCSEICTEIKLTLGGKNDRADRDDKDKN